MIHRYAVLKTKKGMISSATVGQRPGKVLLM